MDPSPHFLVLAATLLDALGPETAPDAVLARLHAVFGPMFTSAMQLVDRREVVRVDIGGRTMYQVTSSAGAPYTLYLDLSSQLPKVHPASPFRGDAGGDGDVEMDADDPEAAAAKQKAKEEEAAREKAKAKVERAARIRHAADRLAQMYCPCTGYAFNALDGRQILCKHLLAVLVAHRLGRVVETSVGIHVAAGLLGLIQVAA